MMKFGKLLNGGRDKDRSSSRGFSRGAEKNGHIGRVTEDKFPIKRQVTHHYHHHHQPPNGHTTESNPSNSDLLDITNPRPAPRPPNDGEAETTEEDIRGPEPLQRKPDPVIPGYTSLAHRHQQQQLSSQQASPEAPWSSRFSDSTGRSAAFHDVGISNEPENLPPLQLSSEASGRARGLQVSLVCPSLSLGLLDVYGDKSNQRDRFSERVSEHSTIEPARRTHFHHITLHVMAFSQRPFEHTE